jgi:hypothetical protein
LIWPLAARKGIEPGEATGCFDFFDGSVTANLQ